MTNHVAGKSIVITGAGSGFGRLVAIKAAALGAKVTCGDIDEAAAGRVVDEITAAGGIAQAMKADVVSLDAVRKLVAAAGECYGAVDVMINNAGVMPLAFYADHARAQDAWDRCIDINFKGVLHGIIAAWDPMIAQGRGHVINLSSIYGNHPVIGGAVYGATKSAVNYLSESLRVESRGRIKVTVIRPTGVPSTGLTATIVDQSAGIGSVGQNIGEFGAMLEALAEGSFPPEKLSPDSIEYASLAPEFIADAIIHAIDQPWGVAISDVTVRASGDHFII